MIKEENKMLEIIHNNCKQEQQRRYNQQKLENVKRQERHYKRLNKILLTTGLICIAIETIVLIIEKVR